MTSVINLKYYLNNRTKVRQQAIVLLGLMLFGCAEPGRDFDIVVGALNGPSGLSLVKMMEEDSFNSEPWTASYVIKNDPELIKIMMMQEAIDVALLPLTTAALLYNLGQPYQLAGIPVWGSLFLVGSKDSIAQVADLKGKTVYVMARNMTPDIIFRYILEEKGLNPGQDVELNYAFPTPIELASALQSNRISLGIVSEPMMSQIMSNNPDLHIIFDITEIWNELHQRQPPLVQTALMVRTAWVEEHRDLFQRWCEKYRQSILWINDHASAAGLLAVKYNLTRDAAVATAAIPRSRLDFQDGPDIRQEVLQYLGLLYEKNSRIIGNKIPDDDFFYSK